MSASCCVWYAGASSSVTAVSTAAAGSSTAGSSTAGSSTSAASNAVKCAGGEALPTGRGIPANATFTRLSKTCRILSADCSTSTVGGTGSGSGGSGANGVASLASAVFSGSDCTAMLSARAGMRMGSPDATIRLASGRRPVAAVVSFDWATIE